MHPNTVSLLTAIAFFPLWPIIGISSVDLKNRYYLACTLKLLNLIGYVLQNIWATEVMNCERESTHDVV